MKVEELGRCEIKEGFKRFLGDQKASPDVVLIKRRSED
jgi:hypothetical protein